MVDLPKSSILIGDVCPAAGACGPPEGALPGMVGGVGKIVASFLMWSSRIVFCDAGSEMTLDVGVSSRNLPSLDFHMREADCEGAPPPAGCVLVEQSEQEGGVDGAVGNATTAAFSVACTREVGVS